MDLGGSGRVVARSWRAIAVLAVAGGALLLAFTLTQPRLYQTGAQNFVGIGQLAPDSQDGWSDSSSFIAARVKSYVPLVSSPRVLTPVIEELGLEMSVNQLALMVEASNPLGTSLINISSSGSDPVQIIAIANAVAESIAEQIEALESPTGASSSPVRVTVIKEANEPASPTSPNALSNLFLGLLLGTAVGLVVAAVREYRERRTFPLGAGTWSQTQPGHAEQAEEADPSAARPASHTNSDA